MTPKHTDTKQRKETILHLTIGRYIKTMAPVSSKSLVNDFSLDLSSATIRNVLAELEEEGFLTHPHTSAGRVPTEKGYRYYVDNFLKEIELLEEEKRRIRREYIKEKLELEALLDRTSRGLSDLTHYTSIVAFSEWDNKLFYQGTNFILEYPDDHDINKIRCILKALDEKQHLLEVINRELDKRVEVLIGNEMECEGINNCSLVISRYQMKNGASGRMAVLGPKSMNYDKVVSTLDYFSRLLEEIL